MDHSNTVHLEDVGDDAPGHSGHWQPALRPEILYDTSYKPASGGHKLQAPKETLLDGLGIVSADEEPSPTLRVHAEAPMPATINGDSSKEDDFRPPQEEQPSNPSLSLTTPELQWPSSAREGTPQDHEMVSDEDDERLDPAWGIKPFDTAKLLDTVDRSTTFPDFAPSNEVAEHLPTETVQDRDEDLGSTQAPDPDLQTQGFQVAEQGSSGNLDWMGDEVQRADANGLKDSIQFGVSDLEDPSEARFEEGMPLVQSNEPSSSANEGTVESSGQDVDSSFAEDEDTSFFSNISARDSAPKGAPELERKSTAAVLESLHILNRHKDDSPSPHPGDGESFFNNLETVPASGIGMAPELDQPAPTDVDDALWQAALDEDDEFLIEDADDLLPDSDPGSPESLFGSLQDGSTLQDNRTDSSNFQSMATGLIHQNPPQISRPDAARNQSSNHYAPHQPLTSEIAQLSPTTMTHGNIGLSRPGLAPMNSFQSHLQQRPSAPIHAESFSDQAKGGYKSPYDLPMELSKPRKRAHVPQAVQSSKVVAPPPRSGSLDKQLQSPFSPNTPGFPSVAQSRPPQPSPAIPSRSISASVQPSNSASVKSSPSSFFEELPITTRPRTGTGLGRYTPQQSSNMPQPQILPQSPPTFHQSPLQAQPSPPRPSDPYAQFQLRPPERLDPYANVPLQSAAPTVPAPASTRYSPAPPALLSGPKPNPSPRYSPAPPSQAVPAPSANRYTSQTTSVGPPPHAAPLNRYASQPPPPASASMPSLQFQPRTSSPLAYHKSSIDETVSPMQPPPLTSRASSSAYYGQPPIGPALSSMQQPGGAFQEPPPRPSPPKAPATDGSITGPQRSQTGSPSKQRPRPTIPMPSEDIIHRPASVHGQTSPSRHYAQLDTVPAPRPSFQASGLPEETNFIRPADDTQFDPLQRWKGAPVFRFGFGGSVVSTFPMHVPRYSAGAVRPQIKATVGDVNIRSYKDIVAVPEYILNFPGPLRAKSKKKEVLAWLTASISRLETETPVIQGLRTLPDLQKRHGEKVLLWKILRALVEHDGVLDSNPEALKSINRIITPEVHALDETTASQYRDENTISGIYRPSGNVVRPEPVDPMAIETLRKHLLKGNRQDAVWHAVDCRLWSHALLISSTLDRSVWKQVVQEFVKQEVKTAGTNAESLSALYEIFGGNLEESIDQLVPPSARAGLQMVSKADSTGPTKNALDGLDRWKETLGLVINNRSQGDHRALATLGRLLEDYGRVEASHICYLFSRNQQQPVVFGGADDPQASIVLLCADNRTYPLSFAQDQESILLTEIYEFATLVLASGSMSAFMPHLSVYKLQRASILAGEGYRAEAQSYCDAIASTLKSSTKLSPYYHTVLLGELEELSNRLKQVPVQSSGSWIAKPNLEKVSGSVWNKFSSFVVGDDSDAESKGSGKDPAEAGPFARVAGTPSISRSGSQTDLYGSYPAAAPVMPSTIAGSRYAPNGMSSARSSSELTRGRPSLDSQRSPPSTSYAPDGRPTPYEPVNMFQQGQVLHPINPYQSFGASPPTSHYQATPPQSSYMPDAPVQEAPAASMMQHMQQKSYMPASPPEQSFQPTYEPAPAATSEPLLPPVNHSPYGGYYPQPPPEADIALPVQPEESYGGGYKQTSENYGYGPREDTGYVPYVPEPDSPGEPMPKKKSFVDDEKTEFPRASNAGPSPSPSNDDATARKRANDSAADAAFRAAAEADAARAKDNDKSLKSKPSGWFGGWLGSGGKKSDSLDAPASTSSKGNAKSGPETKIYKANLGESKMKLYYDDKLKKWVNPDNPDAATKTATPTPPPRMGSTPGPPRPSSGANSTMLGGGMAPPSGPPSRATTPASGSGMPPSTLPPHMSAEANASTSANSSGPPSTSGTPPPPPPPSVTGSRPGTAMSGGGGPGSLDDLIGPAMGRKSVKGRKGGKGGRYVDIMAK